VSARILVVEDEPLIRELVTANLVHAGYTVTAVATVAEADRELATRVHAAAIVDVMLPGPNDGFGLVARARRAGATLPIMFLTARGEVQTRIHGFETGADDYLVKPFDIGELLARLRALLRRVPNHRDASRFNLGPLWANLTTGEALTHEGSLVLSDKELKLLRLFASSEGEVLSRADILEDVWGMDRFPTDRTVDNFILRLRKLFEPTPESPRHFITLRSRGYMYRK
jgi:two-component system, OmpR family, alkaline phosphatase synthesis response regulator PhoP